MIPERGKWRGAVEVGPARLAVGKDRRRSLFGYLVASKVRRRRSRYRAPGLERESPIDNNALAGADRRGPDNRVLWFGRSACAAWTMDRRRCYLKLGELWASARFSKGQLLDYGGQDSSIRIDKFKLTQIICTKINRSSQHAGFSWLPT